MRIQVITLFAQAFRPLVELGVTGLVHVSNIPGGNPRHMSSTRALHVGGKKYLPSMNVKVIVTGVDYEKRQIDMVLDEKKPSDARSRRHRKC